jgi:hypothetical protein
MIGNCLSGAGLFYSVLVTAVITDAIKDAVGQPRQEDGFLLALFS